VAQARELGAELGGVGGAEVALTGSVGAVPLLRRVGPHRANLHLGSALAGPLLPHHRRVWGAGGERLAEFRAQISGAVRAHRRRIGLRRDGAVADFRAVARVRAARHRASPRCV